MKYQVFGILWTVFNLALMLVMGIVGIYLLWLVIKALRVYINSHEVRVEKESHPQVPGRSPAGEPCALQNDPGVCFGNHRCQPPSGIQVGKRSFP